MGHVKYNLILVLAFFMLSGCGPERAGWDHFPVKLVSDETFAEPAKNEDLLQAIHFWEVRAGKTLFDYQGVRQNPGSNENRISIQNPWDHGNGVVGLTILNYSDKEILSGNIYINGSVFMCDGICETRGGVSSRVLVIAHELGHFLGLNHSDDPADVMYPTTVDGAKLGAIHADLNALKKMTDVKMN